MTSMSVETPVRVRRSRHSREFLKVELTTEPAIGTWSMTADNGATWVDGAAVPGQAGWFRWMIAGSEAERGDAVLQLGPGSYELVFRGVDSAELVVRNLVVLEIY